ncbi:MAG TPA: hypothetical protein PKA00_23280 [Saprospiraceae bacterium]|nr:hypothetical protein [Saprospiraceae bacterium]HMQ85852.1 hypothetical protein [Saprospiraceae bacterium]
MKQLLFLFFIGFLGITCDSPEQIIVNTRLGYDENFVEVDALMEAIYSRLDQFGFSDHKVLKGGNGEIIVAATIVKSRLNFYNSLLQPKSLELWNTFRVTDDAIFEKTNGKLNIEGLKPYYEFEQGMYPREVIGACSNESELMRIQAALEDSLSSIKDLKLVWSKDPQEHNEDEYLLYMIDTKGAALAPISEKDVASSTLSKGMSSEEYAVNFKLNERGTAIWSEMTQSAAMDDNRAIAIVVGGRVLSCPRVMSPILSGSCQITGGFTREEAEHLEEVMMIERYAQELKIISQEVKSLEEN